MLKTLFILLASFFGLGSVLSGVACVLIAVFEKPLTQEEKDRLIYRS